MRIIVRPTRAIVTVGNLDGSVGIETVNCTVEAVDRALSNYGVDRSPAKEDAFLRWFQNKDRKVGDILTVFESTKGDSVASVVLV